MIGVDVNQTGVKSDGALIKRDQPADGGGVDVAARVIVMLSRPFSHKARRVPCKKPEQIIAGGDARLDFRCLRLRAAVSTSMKVTKKLLTPSRNCCT